MHVKKLLAELRRLQREIRDWSVSQMIWPTMDETLKLIDQRCEHLQHQIKASPSVEAMDRVEAVAYMESLRAIDPR